MHLEVIIEEAEFPVREVQAMYATEVPVQKWPKLPVIGMVIGVVVAAIVVFVLIKVL